MKQFFIPFLLFSTLLFSSEKSRDFEFKLNPGDIVFWGVEVEGEVKPLKISYAAKGEINKVAYVKIFNPSKEEEKYTYSLEVGVKTIDKEKSEEHWDQEYAKNKHEIESPKSISKAPIVLSSFNNEKMRIMDYSLPFVKVDEKLHSIKLYIGKSLTNMEKTIPLKGLHADYFNKLRKKLSKK